MEAHEAAALRSIVTADGDRAVSAKRAAEWIAKARKYCWVGIYEVTATEIGMISCSGSQPPAFPRFPVARGLCGAAVAAKSIVNVGSVQEDPRWLTTFGSTRSEIIVPILGRDARVRGLIDVESDVLNAFCQVDEIFLSECAAAISGLF